MTIQLPTQRGYLEPNTILKEGIFKPSFLSELCFSAHAYAFFFLILMHSFISSFSSCPCKANVDLNTTVVVVVGGNTKIHNAGFLFLGRETHRPVQHE